MLERRSIANIAIIIKVESAYISGVTEPLPVIEYILRGSVSIVPEVKWLITKSSKDIVNAIIRPEKIPGIIWGSSILKNAFEGVQPRSIAASVREGSICLTLGITDNIT